MRKTTFIAVTMVVLLFGHWAQAGVSVIMNGSFENDACSIYDITVFPPYRWDDIDLPEGKFGGYVDTDWSTHGDYSLTLYSDGFGLFDVNDMATVSQQVYLTDVSYIIFNLKLSTDWLVLPWDPNKFSAVLLIDGDVVWDSNNYEPDENDEYREQTWPLDEKYKDGSLHTLSLGIRANMEQPGSLIYHIARWDFVRFDTHCDCGGFDYPPGDFNRDCSVDWLDFQMLFEQWLVEGLDKKYDLFPDEDDIFNFYDFAVFANVWIIGGSVEEPDDYLLYGDLNNDGIVNLKDLAITAEDWGCEEADLYEILTLAEEWLEKNWLYGLE